MSELEKIKVWEQLKSEINKIYDQKTRSLYYRALLARFVNEYGFNPENPVNGQKNTVNVDSWEKEFIGDIQDTISYGLDVREEKRHKTIDETRKNMREYVRTGNSLADIPEDIRTPYIQRLYFEELFKIGDELCQAADDLMENNDD